MYTAREQVKSDFAEAVATNVGGEARMQKFKTRGLHVCVYARARVCACVSQNQNIIQNQSQIQNQS